MKFQHRPSMYLHRNLSCICTPGRMGFSVRIGKHNLNNGYDDIREGCGNYKSKNIVIIVIIIIVSISVIIIMAIMISMMKRNLTKVGLGVEVK